MEVGEKRGELGEGESEGGGMAVGKKKGDIGQERREEES